MGRSLKLEWSTVPEGRDTFHPVPSSLLCKEEAENRRLHGRSRTQRMTNLVRFWGFQLLFFFLEMPDIATDDVRTILYRIGIFGEGEGGGRKGSLVNSCMTDGCKKVL